MNDTPANETVVSSVSDVRDSPLDALVADRDSRLATVARVTGKSAPATVPVAAFNSAI
jgi:FXSXX-COOH protein